jgi:site-specific DNA-methyltransferase (adenine-specific)
MEQLMLFRELLSNPGESADVLPPSLDRVQSGDLWQLGAHRLLCGDARVPGDVRRLMQGEIATLAQHDPPYGLRAKMEMNFGDGKPVAFNGKKIPRSAMSPIFGENEPFNPAHLLKSGQTVVIWGANHFADKLPASAAWIVWDKRIDMPRNHLSDGEAAWVSQGNRLLIVHHQWYGFIRASERGEKRVHPNQKPVALFSKIIEMYTKPGDCIADWYCGSGTSLIAAERTMRRAYVMEVSSEYCSIILARWERETAKTAMLMHRIDEKGGVA